MSAASPTVLVVDDDPKTVENLRLYLDASGYRTRIARDGITALAIALSEPIDLLLLDVMLPKMDGFEVCRRIREESYVPIILVTARAFEVDKLRALDEDGADDYITKPYSPKEVVARVGAVLRRTRRPPLSRAAWERGALRIDAARHEAFVRDERVALTPTEFRLLASLAENYGIAIARSALIELVLGFDYRGLERTIDVHVMNLRRKLAVFLVEGWIQTVPGVGYLLEV